MDERYVAFDVETPNAQNRRMSAIGVCVIEQGQIVQELDTLVDPETHFDPFNVALTGITPEMLTQQGVEKWEAAAQFAAAISHPNTLIVAYNAQFDLCFLYYFLARLERADALKGVKMLDAMTVYKDRRQYPHKLQSAIDAYGVTTQNTHRAVDDAKAALEVLDAMAREEDDLLRYVNLFGYNPKYGVSGPRISSITYLPQGRFTGEKLYHQKAPALL